MNNDNKFKFTWVLNEIYRMALLNEPFEMFRVHTWTADGKFKNKNWILKILDANLLSILQINMRDNFKSDPGFLAAQWFNKRLKYSWSRKETDKIQRL